MLFNEKGKTAMTWTLILWVLSSQVAVTGYPDETKCQQAAKVAVNRGSKGGVKTYAYCIPGPY